MVIDLLQDNQRGRADREHLTGHNLAMSIITVGEVYEGVYGSSDPVSRGAGFKALLKAVTVVDLTTPMMKSFARTRFELRGSGNLIGDLDLLIASTALLGKRTLLTRNSKHFDRVPGLNHLAEAA